MSLRVLLLASLLLATAPLARAQTNPSRPNVVILLADDLGSGDVGWRGGEIKTPNIDRLAAAGTKLDAFYVMPVCSPTRAALLTGRYPFRYGLQVSVVKPWATYGLPVDERTLPQALHEVGYETAIVGKWHLGHAKPEYLPMARGFEHQYGHYNGALDYYTHVRDGGYDWHRDGKRSDDQGYSTELLGAEAVRLIHARDRSRPLFLYVPFQAVHAPYEDPPQRYLVDYQNVQRPRRRAYMGMVAAMDEQVGRITQAIHDEGMDANTLILFASDNGGPDPGVVTSNGDLRAGKGTLYEGGVRVCASATWPGVIPAGATIQQPVHVVDWYATILALGGAKADQPKAVDGRDILSLLKGDDHPVHDEIDINVAPNSGAIRAGQWKLVINGFRHIAEEANDPSATLKRADRYELFDVVADPQEKHDVSTEHREIVDRLRQRYEALLKTAAPAFSEADREPNFHSPAVWGEFPATQPSTGMQKSE